MRVFDDAPPRQNNTRSSAQTASISYVVVTSITSLSPGENNYAQDRIFARKKQYGFSELRVLFNHTQENRTTARGPSFDQVA